MDKVIYTNDDLDFLLKWRDENQNLVRTNPCPLRAVKIIASDSDITMTCVRSGVTVEVTITMRGKGYGKIIFEIMAFGLYRTVKNTAKILKDEDIQSVVTAYASTMALLTYGSAYNAPSKESQNSRKTPQKPRKGTKRSGATYILKRSGKEAHIVKQGSHRKPEGTFTVRGHFRHYRNGKVIWIEEYMKGSGDKKDKTYRL